MPAVETSIRLRIASRIAAARLLRSSFSALLILVLFVPAAAADEPTMGASSDPRAVSDPRTFHPPIAPRLCTGYREDTGTWGRITGDGFSFSNCPPGTALFAVEDTGEGLSSAVTGPAGVKLEGDCCPLPAPDILTDRETFAISECPEGSIATGSSPFPRIYTCTTQAACDAVVQSQQHYIRCTGINLDRYQLGPTGAGRYWGFGFSHRKDEAVVTSRARIPAAIRYGIGRLFTKRWDVDGCIGYPWGSLLTKKTNGSCDGFFFRELQFRGLEGDPPSGTPVPMYPQCEGIKGQNTANPICIE